MDVGQQRVKDYTLVSGLVCFSGIRNIDEKIGLSGKQNVEYEEYVGTLMELYCLVTNNISESQE